MSLSEDYTQTFVTINTPIFDVIRIVNETVFRIALVVTEDSKLVGTITDGDVRRGLLSGATLEDPVSKIMFRTPHTVKEGTSDKNIYELMMDYSILQVPVVDDNNCVVGCEFRDDLREKLSHSPEDKDDIWVVLMLGGLGKRLFPLTENLPKPMLEVGGKPLLETILRRFADQGFQRFFFSVNFKADIIRDYFGDGSRFGVTIDYLEEDKPMGTAGALYHLPAKPPAPFIVMNGDILTDISFVDLSEFHFQHNVMGTMCVGEYKTEIPYGIVKNSGVELQTIIEKPTESYFINAGIYVLDPEILDLVGENNYMDMPQLFEQIAEKGEKSVIYPIHEYWKDIGSPDDLEQARKEYERYFT